MRSLVDTALNTAMGTLTETHGVPIKVIFADTDQSVVVRGIFNENGIINTMSQSGIPMESMEIQVGFRKTDLRTKGFANHYTAIFWKYRIVVYSEFIADRPMMVSN